jgi:hypothetical protein
MGLIAAVMPMNIYERGRHLSSSVGPLIRPAINVPRQHHWIADALDDGLRLAVIVEDVKPGWLSRRRAKFVSTRIIVLYGGRQRVSGQKFWNCVGDPTVDLR